ncbi:MAG: hypothetical protein JKY89_08190 [Immundisolibacteraceae bacterium]|nr:hypothetical protein [Immundisolibacteraceae bacterium]
MSEDVRINVTQDMRNEMVKQINRTGCGAAALITYMKDQGTLPDELTCGMINAYIKGRIMSAQILHMKVIMNSWAMLKNKDEIFTTITPKIIKQLKIHAIRTGISETRLIKGRDDLPNKLTCHQIGSWTSGATKTAKTSSLNYVLKLWENTPDKPEYKKITAGMLEQINNHKSRTGKGTSALLRGMRNKIPDGLNSGIVSSWTLGKNKTARKDHWECIIKLYEQTASLNNQVDVPKNPKYQEISEEIREEVNAHIKRTGIGVHSILRGNNPDKPHGIYGQAMGNLLRGKTSRIRKDWLNYFIKRWEATPDRLIIIKKQSHPRGTIKEGYTIINGQQLKWLKKYQEQTFLPSLILKSEDKPKDLSTQMISTWLSSVQRTAKKEHLDFVFAACEKLARHPQQPIVIDDKTRGDLQRYYERTGIGGVALLKGKKKIPDGLTPDHISKWINGYTATARKDHLKYVMKLYAERLSWYSKFF